MSRIRKLYYFDKPKALEMISFLNNSVSDTYISKIMFNPLLILHHLLPLNLKFLPESFVLKVDNELKGLITVAPTKSKYKKMEIQKLLFEENALVDAVELVQYVVSKYKALGAPSIMVKVDDYLPELLSIFITQCGFSQISYEKLWRVNKFTETPFNKKIFRSFKNSDVKAVTNLYNDSLLPHFRPLLGREVKEFKENLFKGLSYYSEYKYIIEDEKTKAVLGCIIIQTTDNENYLVDLIQTNWVEIDTDSVLSFVFHQIKKRKKRVGVFFRTRRYCSTGEKQESIFMQKGFECVQNQIVLTNSSARVLKEPIKSDKYTVLADFFPSKPIPTQCKEM